MMVLSLLMLAMLATEAPAREIILILGKPAAGKGTQAPHICEVLGIPHLSTGDMLRDAVNAKTPLGLKVKVVMDKGELVPNNIVNGIVADRIKRADCDKGVLLDGYPRDVEQADFLDGHLADSGESISDVLYLMMPTKAETDCVLGRWVAPKSGKSYGPNCIDGIRPKSLPPGAQPVCDPDDLAHCNMKDDETGDALVRRADDNLKDLEVRLKSFRRDTLPVIAHYSLKGVVRELNANQPKEKVRESIEKALHISSGMAMVTATEAAAGTSNYQVLLSMAIVVGIVVFATIGTALVKLLRAPGDGVMSVPLLGS